MLAVRISLFFALRSKQLEAEAPLCGARRDLDKMSRRPSNCCHFFNVLTEILNVKYSEFCYLRMRPI